jgi:hypothetical protein
VWGEKSLIIGEKQLFLLYLKEGVSPFLIFFFPARWSRVGVINGFSEHVMSTILPNGPLNEPVTLCQNNYVFYDLLPDHIYK